MTRLVIKDNITCGRSLTPGQIQKLGGFIMGARKTTKPTTPPIIARHLPRIGLGYSEKMDQANISSLSELLDHIAALGVSTYYGWIGLKPDQREINHPTITHLVVVVKE